VNDEQVARVWMLVAIFALAVAIFCVCTTLQIKAEHDARQIKGQGCPETNYSQRKDG